MQLQQASKKRAKIKMALQGPSGSGKTYSALLIAYGITNDWSSIAVIDTENHSANLYAHLGNYNVLNIDAPFTPEKFIQAIKLCESAGMKILILDGISGEWESILDIHANMTGNSFTNWSKLTPRHNEFVQTILQSPLHIIATIRTKQDYVLQEKNGKQVPEKVGLKAITREGMDYEFTIVLDIDIKHHATASKDRTQLFIDKPEFTITSDTGKRILQWCNQTDEVEIKEEENIQIQIQECTNIKDLINLYGNSSQNVQTSYKELFALRRDQLQSITNINPAQQNGTYITTR
jgi:hypothetical protein